MPNESLGCHAPLKPQTDQQCQACSRIHPGVANPSWSNVQLGFWVFSFNSFLPMPYPSADKLKAALHVRIGFSAFACWRAQKEARGHSTMLGLSMMTFWDLEFTHIVRIATRSLMNLTMWDAEKCRDSSMMASREVPESIEKGLGEVWPIFSREICS